MSSRAPNTVIAVALIAALVVLSIVGTVVADATVEVVIYMFVIVTAWYLGFRHTPGGQG